MGLIAFSWPIPPHRIPEPTTLYPAARNRRPENRLTSILVTGGTGAMGSWVTRRLVDRGLRPICYDWAPTPRLLGDIAEKIEMVRGDVRDLPLLLDTLRRFRVERIIHMAYLLTESEVNPPLALQVNLGGMVNILEAARFHDVKRVVFTSSKGVYGDITEEHGHPTYTPINEDYRKEPNNIYGVTKFACEGFGQHYAETYGLDFLALRFANTFGPGKTVERHGPYTLPGSMLEWALVGRPLRIPVGGESSDDLLYYKDVAKSVVLACFAESVQHRAFNIGLGSLFRLQDSATVVRKIVPGAQIEIGPGLDYKYGGKYPYAGYCRFDTTRAQQELGFTPDYDLEDAMRDYAAELRRLNLLQ